MIKELDTVVLTEDLPEHSLKRGDLGTVVLVHAAEGYEVEFMTLDGQTLAVVSLYARQVRPVGRREIAQARGGVRPRVGGSSPCQDAIEADNPRPLPSGKPAGVANASLPMIYMFKQSIKHIQAVD